MTDRPRTPLDIYSEALCNLEAEPGPLTPEKADLLLFLRDLVDKYATSQRLISALGHRVWQPFSHELQVGEDFADGFRLGQPKRRKIELLIRKLLSDRSCNLVSA